MLEALDISYEEFIGDGEVESYIPRDWDLKYKIFDGVPIELYKRGLRHIDAQCRLSDGRDLFHHQYEMSRDRAFVAPYTTALSPSSKITVLKIDMDEPDLWKDSNPEPHYRVIADKTGRFHAGYILASPVYKGPSKPANPPIR